MTQAIAAIQKNVMEKIIATLGEYQGKPRIDIRTYFQPKQKAHQWEAIPNNVVRERWCPVCTREK